MSALAVVKPGLEARFWAKVDVRGEVECWLWTGATITDGYGHLRIGGRSDGTIYAHVLAVMLDGRAPGPGQEVHHSCETRSCCNPAHLEVLTFSEHHQRHRPATCIRGHSRGEAYFRSDGRVAYCKVCRRESRAR